MVAHKSNKAVKLSYADRVLAAISTTQMEKRQHAIHLATVRARVRKDADAANDPLGRNWGAFVSRAVDRLIADGILSLYTLSSPGKITVTEAGKKLISAARSTTDAPASPASFNHVLKNQNPTHASPSPNRKRGRKSSRRVSHVHLEYSDDEADTPTKKQKITPPKKAKRTKLAEFEEIFGHRELSPMTDLEEDDSEDQMIPQTPTPLSRHAGAVIRTHSGTLIPNHSKQPTPAPTDAGSTPEYDIDVFGHTENHSLDVQDYTESELQTLKKELEHQQCFLKEKDSQIENLTHSISELTQTIDNLNKNLTDSHHEISRKTVEIQQIESLADNTRSENAKLMQDAIQLRSENAILSSSVERLGELEIQLAELEGQLQTTISARDLFQEQYNAATERLQVQAERVTALELSSVELESRNAALNVELTQLKQSHSLEVTALKSSLQGAEARIDELLVDSKLQADENREKDKGREAQIAVLEANMTSMQAELDNERLEHEKDIIAKDSEIGEKDRQLERLQKELDAQIRDGRDQKAQLDTLSLELEAKNKEASRLTEMNGRLKETFAGLKQSQLAAWTDAEDTFNA
ncbi:hypothetical protein C8J56DRAFT_280678 [Mycena floridula]|nr:hypothetical protein C8J56DRAFT_280678 [Mycena floridula]